MSINQISVHKPTSKPTAHLGKGRGKQIYSPWRRLGYIKRISQTACSQASQIPLPCTYTEQRRQKTSPPWVWCGATQLHPLCCMSGQRGCTQAGVDVAAWIREKPRLEPWKAPATWSLSLAIFSLQHLSATEAESAEMQCYLDPLECRGFTLMLPRGEPVQHRG